MIHGKCKICGEKGLLLGEVEILEGKVFGRIPLAEVVKMWYAQGYNPADIVCKECIEK